MDIESPHISSDALTGLPGRTAFLAQVAALLPQLPDPGDAPAVLSVDLDRFKAVNDSLGNEVGDVVLQRVAKRIRDACGPQAFTARISGDEFGVFLPRTSGAKELADRMLEVLARPCAVRGHIVNLTASIGIASSTQGMSAAELVGVANIALHHAEKAGGNQYVVFELPMQESANRRFLLERDLRAAIALQQKELQIALELDQFSLVYQPQFNLESRRVSGFEALIRWSHPQRGVISPGDFIPLAEEIGLIGQIGTWVLRTACCAAAKWPGDGGPQLLISVNVSAQQVNEDPAFVQLVAQALAESGLAPERLVLEITESIAVGDVAEVLLGIQNLGVQLSVDDFGMGFSSLSHLSRFGFDRLKIDRSFVHALAPAEPASSTGRPTEGTALKVSRRAQAAWILRAITGLGIGLGLSTLAEGVENQIQENILRLAGVKEAQGFFYCRPLSEDEVLQFMAQYRFGSSDDGGWQ